MTKDELRTQYVGQGWTVQPTASWIKTSDVDGKLKYDVNVVSPDNIFGTAQVIVTGDGTSSEAASAWGMLKAPAATFDQDLRAFLDSKEGGAVYCIAVTNSKPSDEVATVVTYETVTGGVSAKNYVVKRRAGVFAFQPLV